MLFLDQIIYVKDYIWYNVIGDIMEINSVNVLVLAYLGDNVYEYYVRKFLIEQQISNVNQLQSNAVNYVSASNQARFLKELMAKDFFVEEELDVIRRARNHKCTSHPKSCDIVTYKYATALEALIGFLEMKNKRNRIEEIMNLILGGVIC